MWLAVTSALVGDEALRLSLAEAGCSNQGRFKTRAGDHSAQTLSQPVSARHPGRPEILRCTTYVGSVCLACCLRSRCLRSRRTGDDRQGWRPPTPARMKLQPERVRPGADRGVQAGGPSVEPASRDSPECAARTAACYSSGTRRRALLATLLGAALSRGCEAVRWSGGFCVSTMLL